MLADGAAIVHHFEWPARLNSWISAPAFSSLTSSFESLG